MSIVAKFAGKCLACGGRIAVGEQINWAKGEGSRHVDCAPSRSKPLPRRRSSSGGGGGGRPRAPRGPAFPDTAPEPGAHLIEGRRSDRHDHRYDVGQVVHAPKVKIPGGGPDNAYYVVLSRKLVAPNEDNGSYDWAEYAWVRAATAEEAEALAKEIRHRDAPKAVAAYVLQAVKAGERIPEEDARGAIPAGVDKADVWRDAKGELHAVAIVGDVVVGYHGGHYDDYRASAWRAPATERLVAAVRALASGHADAIAVAADMAQETAS